MGYSKMKIKEPLILEPEDWSQTEWKVLEKLFSLSCATRIVVSDYTLESYEDGEAIIKAEDWSPDEWKFIQKLLDDKELMRQAIFNYSGKMNYRWTVWEWDVITRLFSDEKVWNYYQYNDTVGLLAGMNTFN